jgi:hypothetical protein
MLRLSVNNCGCRHLFHDKCLSTESTQPRRGWQFLCRGRDSVLIECVFTTRNVSEGLRFRVRTVLPQDPSLTLRVMIQSTDWRGPGQSPQLIIDLRTYAMPSATVRQPFDNPGC